MEYTKTITWTTPVASDSRVDYGPTDAYGDYEYLEDLVTDHEVEISGISPIETYHYKVTSEGDEYSYESEDDTFTTSFAAEDIDSETSGMTQFGGKTTEEGLM
jgi:hypothetical protein